jgi:hypothetical protein
VTDYAELEKRLREAAERSSNYFAEETREAADAIAALIKKLEEARTGLITCGERVSSLAFKMEAPNPWTPQFVALGQSMQSYAHGLRLSTAQAPAVTGQGEK